LLAAEAYTAAKNIRGRIADGQQFMENTITYIYHHFFKEHDIPFGEKREQYIKKYTHSQKTMLKSFNDCKLTGEPFQLQLYMIETKIQFIPMTYYISSGMVI